MSTPVSLGTPHGPGRPEREAAWADDVGLALLLGEYSSEHTAERTEEGPPQRPIATETEMPVETTASDDVAPASGRAGWTALIATMLARACLFTIGSLVLWSAMPALLGWHPTVVVTGSMEPRIRIGDVVISRPIAPQHIRVGQILLVDDPDRPGELRLHRLARITPQGLILRGDANTVDDSTPVKRSAVHGLAVLRTPAIGQPMVWFRAKQFVPLVAAFVLLALLLRVATWWRPDPQDESDDDDAERSGSGPLTTEADRPDHVRRGGRHRRRRHNLIRFGTAVTLVLTIVGNPFDTQRASAAFVRSTANPTNSWAGSNYFSCGASIGASPRIPATVAWPLADNGGSTAADVSGNGSTGTFTAGVYGGQPGPCTGDGGRSIYFDGSSGSVYGNTKLAPVPTTLSSSIWFLTTVGGGGLMGFTSSQTGTASSAYDRQLWLTDDGRIAYGVYTSTYKTITTSASYLDGRWHHVVATLTPSGTYQGMRLYVDGALVPGTITAPGTVYGYDGWPRVGYVKSTGWPSASTKGYFTGYLAFAVVYSSALSPAQVADVNDAAGGVTVLEGEDMPIGTSSQTPAYQANCCGITWRNGANMGFIGTGVGSYMTLTFYVPVARTYELLLVQTMFTGYAINTVAIDGTTVGAPFDAYSSTVRVSTPISYGSMSLSAGNHTIRMTIVNRNASSSNWYMGLDYLILR